MQTTVINNCPVTLTPNALNEMKRLLNENAMAEGVGLRVGVKGGGCAGFSYLIGFDEQKPDDLVFQQDGLTIYLDKLHEMYLKGTRLDYKDDLDARGFIFDNPNASSTCGCGTSFGA